MIFPDYSQFPQQLKFCHKQIINGPTLVDDPNKHLTIGDDPDSGPWIGDFPWKRSSREPILIPSEFLNDPVRFQRLTDVITATNIPFQQHLWTVNFQEKRCIASIDVPGCKVENIEIHHEEGRVFLVATRNPVNVVRASAFIGKEFDIENGDAEIEDGVLTVIFARLPEKPTKKIKVKKK